MIGRTSSDRQPDMLGGPALSQTSGHRFAAAGSPDASADPLTFVGFDINAGPGDARPNADSAAAHFDAAASLLGSLTLTTFESLRAGPFSSLTVGGMTLTSTDVFGADQEFRIRNTSGGGPGPFAPLSGYNTTTGGENYVELSGSTLTSTLGTPGQAFGFYFTGSQLEGNTVTFNDGSAQSFTLPFGADTFPDGPPFGGGVGFFGFIDEGKSISSIRISVINPDLTGDIIGVDDVRQVASPVPEPASAVLLALGLGVPGARRWRQRKA